MNEVITFVWYQFIGFHSSIQSRFPHMQYECIISGR